MLRHLQPLSCSRGPAQAAVCAALLCVAVVVSWLAAGGLPLAGATALNKPTPERLVDETSGMALEALPLRGLTSLALRGGSTQSTPQRVEALGRLLERYFSAHAKQPGYRFAFAVYPELNDRMVAEAACSPQWDIRRGRARAQSAADWLKQLAAKSDLVPELRLAWQAHGYRLSIGSIERVMLCTHAEIDWPRVTLTCAAPRIDKRGRYPCGADIGFVVQAT